MLWVREEGMTTPIVSQRKGLSLSLWETDLKTPYMGVAFNDVTTVVRKLYDATARTKVHAHITHSGIIWNLARLGPPLKSCARYLPRIISWGSTH